MLTSLGSGASALAPLPHSTHVCFTPSCLAPVRRPASAAHRCGTEMAVGVEAPCTSYLAGPSAAMCRLPHHRRRGAAQRCASGSSSDTCHGGSNGPEEPGSTGGTAEKVGVVIVDHGSRKRASNDMLVEFGDLYGKVTGHEIVEIAHMEIAEPTIAQAIGRCAARGANTVVVAPYFLSRGRHIQEDIPALVAEARELHPGLRCIIAEPIGIDVLMVNLISNRVRSALSTAGAPSA